MRRYSYVIIRPQASESGLHFPESELHSHIPLLPSELLVLQYVLTVSPSPLQALLSFRPYVRPLSCWCSVTGIRTMYSMSVCCLVPVECQVPLV
jgi:hypothetical protein